MPFRVVLAFLLLFLVPGCVSQATKTHIDVQIAAHEGYERLANAALAGELEGGEAKNNVTSEDLQRTPSSVKVLLNRTFKAAHKSKLSYHALKFTLGDGEDPDTLDLGEPVRVPSGADDVLGPGDGE